MSDSLARALAAPAPAAQPFGNQDMLARILMGNPDPGLPQYPVMQSAEGRGFAPMPTSMGDMGARMGAVLRGQVEPTPGERYGMDVPLGWVAGSGGSARDGIRAYHGSPHQFDRFDMSRIGTGEGAQAYGHGLYFAGNEGVARGYRDALSSTARNWSVDDVPLDKLHGSLDPMNRLKYEIGIAARNQGGTAQDAIDFVINQKRGALTSRRTFPEDLPVLNEEIDTLLRMRNAPPSITQQPGSMYEVRLNTTPDRLLDWDAPLSRQPQAVQESLAQFGIKYDAPGMAAYDDALLAALNDSGPARLPRQPSNPTGGEIYENSRIVPGAFRDPVAAAATLREAGIPGIQYLDAGSRAAGDGTRNYVMFDESLIDILRRYGLAGMLAGGAASQAQAGEP